MTGLIFGIAALLASFVVAISVGGTMLTKLSGLGNWDGGGKIERSPARIEIDWTAGFDPLELEPYEQKWPSEEDYPTLPLPPQEWPSTHWDDPHFGKYAGTGSTESAVQAAERAKAEAERAAKRRNPKKAQQQQQQQQQERRDRRERQKKKQARQQQARAEQQARAPQPKRQEPSRAAKAQEVASRAAEAGFFGEAASGTPSAQQVAAWVQSEGLAGAVQKIRAVTGWDFKQAAQHLSKVMREMS